MSKWLSGLQARDELAYGRLRQARHDNTITRKWYLAKD